MAAVVETEGAYISVTDEQILEAIPALARGAGVFSEPAGAAAYGGLVKAMDQGLVSSNETIVVLNTGNGLKDIASAMDAVKRDGTKPYHVSPHMDAFEKIAAGLGLD